MVSINFVLSSPSALRLSNLIFNSDTSLLALSNSLDNCSFALISKLSSFLEVSKRCSIDAFSSSNSLIFVCSSRFSSSSFFIDDFRVSDAVSN